MRLGAVSLVAFCASMPCPLSHFAPGCPFLQSRDAPGSHVLCPQDATGSPILCRILRLCALSFNREMRLGAVSSVAFCASMPCPLSHLAPWSPVLQSQDATGSRVLGRILHQYALSSVAFCARVPFPSIARCAR